LKKSKQCCAKQPQTIVRHCQSLIAAMMHSSHSVHSVFVAITREEAVDLAPLGIVHFDEGDSNKPIWSDWALDLLEAIKFEQRGDSSNLSNVQQ
jgi:hypothetical protein